MTLLNTFGESTSVEARPGRSRNGSSGAQTQPERKQARSQGVNVGEAERIVSVAAGTIVALQGLYRRSVPGMLLACVGGALVYRGATGHCSAYASLGLNTAQAGQEEGQGSEQIGENGIHIEQSFLINRPAEELYAYWRNFENLPRIMSHLDSVSVQGDRRSHWIAKAHGLGNKRFEWDAEITHDEPDTLIGWRSLPGADVENTGQIRFSPALGDRGTEVHVFIDYVPPAGRLGHWIASMLGQNPRRVVREDLRNFKRIMELGEIPTLIGQPNGSCSGRGKPYTESEWKPLFT